MLLYEHPRAPSPRRVRMYLDEKGLDVPRREVDLATDEQFSGEYAAINPDGVVPTLVLDDGTAISESMAIIRYFEASHPDPPLLGQTPKEQALVEMWNRKIELEGYAWVAHFLRNSVPTFRGRAIPGVRDGFEQIPALAEQARRVVKRLLERLNAQLADSPFVALESFSVADISLFVTLHFGRRLDLELPEHVQRWLGDVQARPSAQ